MARPNTGTLTWHDAQQVRPAADAAVLLWTVGPGQFAGPGWVLGCWDGRATYRLLVSGDVCPGMVTHWAQPTGPRAVQGSRA